MRYIYLGETLKTKLLKNQMVVDKETRDKLVNEAKEFEELFLSLEEYSSLRNDLKNKKSFVAIKIKKAMEKLREKGV